MVIEFIFAVSSSHIFASATVCRASPSPRKAPERRTRRLNFSQIRCPGRFLSEDDDFVKLGWYPVSVFPATSCRHAVSPANMPRVRSEREAVRSSSLWLARRRTDCASLLDDASCVNPRHERPRELFHARFLQSRQLACAGQGQRLVVTHHRARRATTQRWGLALPGEPCAPLQARVGKTVIVHLHGCTRRVVWWLVERPRGRGHV